MNCPNCGAPPYKLSSAGDEFECGSFEPTDDGDDEQRDISTACYRRQISQLKAELSQCVRRDDPRLVNALSVLENASFASTDWKSAERAHKQLQSIIEGK